MAQGLKRKSTSYPHGGAKQRERENVNKFSAQKKGVSPIVATLLIIGIIVVAGVFLYFMTVNLMQENQPEEAEFAVLAVSAGLDSASPGMRDFWGHHYWEVSEGNYQDYIQKCVEAYGHPVTLALEEENNKIYEWFGPTVYWIGCYQEVNGSEPRGGWRWVTGEPLVYTNWAPGQPDDYHSAQDVCASGDGWEANWDDATATVTFIKGVCERLALSFTITNQSSKPVVVKKLTVRVDKLVNGVPRSLYKGTLGDSVTISVADPVSFTYELPRFVCDRETLNPGDTTTCHVVALPSEPFGLTFRVCVGEGAPIYCDTTR